MVQHRHKVIIGLEPKSNFSDEGKIIHRAALKGLYVSFCMYKCFLIIFYCQCVNRL